MPFDIVDRLTYLRLTAEVRMDRGLALPDLPSSMATPYRTPPAGRVALVLGGGNVSSIGPLDAIHKLVVDRQVVVLKLHPVMAHLADVTAAALAPFVAEGVLRIVTGDAVQGAYLANHPGVDVLHITGSDRTYDAIVFGTGPEGEARRRRDDPVLAKPFTAELGNLTPIVVVPGRWSERELDHQAENIATMLANNAGFNCTTSRVIVTAGGWSQREALLDRLRRRLAQLPCRFAFYPGAAARFAAFREAHPQGELFGGADHDHLPWMLIPGFRPTRRTTPPTGSRRSAASWPRRRSTRPTPRPSSTVRCVRERARLGDAQRDGHRRPAHRPRPRGRARPRSRARPAPVRDRRAQHVVRHGLRDRDHAVGRGARQPEDGDRLRDGLVHNPLMFERVEKVVIRGPFVAWPRPPWFMGHRTALPLMQELARFEADGAPPACCRSAGRPCAPRSLPLPRPTRAPARAPRTASAGAPPAPRAAR